MTHYVFPQIQKQIDDFAAEIECYKKPSFWSLQTFLPDIVTSQTLRWKVSRVFSSWEYELRVRTNSNNKFTYPQFEQLKNSYGKLHDIFTALWPAEQLDLTYAGLASEGECLKRSKYSLQWITNQFLLDAIVSGDIEGVKRALKEGANPSKPNMSQVLSPLHAALESNMDPATRKSITVILFEAGAKTGIVCLHPRNIVHSIVDLTQYSHIPREERLEILKEALDRGGEFCSPTPSLFEQYAQLGFSLDYRAPDGKNLLHFVVGSYKPPKETFAFFAQRLPHLWQQSDSRGQLPLMVAVAKGYTPLIEDAISGLKGCNGDVNCRSTDGKTVAHALMMNIAVYFKENRDLSDEENKPENRTKRFLSTLEQFAAHGIDFTVADQAQRIPLYYAIKHCSNWNTRFSVCEALCKLDKAKARYPLEELKLAVETGWENIVELILTDYGLPEEKICVECLERAADLGDKNVIKIIFDKMGGRSNIEDLRKYIEGRFRLDPSQGFMDVLANKHSSIYSHTQIEFDNNQKYYNRKWFEAIKTAAANYRKWTYLQIIDYFAEVRHQLAIDLQKDNSPNHITHWFGQRRYMPSDECILDCPVETELVGGYEVLKERVKQFDTRKYGKYIQVKNEDGEIWITIQGFLSGEKNPIPLTTLTPDKIGHTHKRYVRRMMSEAKMLSAKLEKEQSKLSDSEFIERIGEIHWLHAQSIFWNRGSAAGSDAYAKTQLFAYDFDVPHWKPGVMPDFEILLCANREEFAKNYVNFFVRPPKRRPPSN